MSKSVGDFANESKRLSVSKPEFADFGSVRLTRLYCSWYFLTWSASNCL